MKTTLAFLIIGLSSLFEMTVQDPIGSAAHTGLDSCATRITQEQGQSLATLFSILVLKSAQSKDLGTQSACDSRCLIKNIASVVKLVANLKNCGINVIAETMVDCLDADANTAKAAVFLMSTRDNIQSSLQMDFNDDIFLQATLCMLNKVASGDGLSFMSFFKNIPSDLADRLGITMNNANRAAEILQGLSSLGSATSISSSGNIGLRNPGVVSTIGQLPTQIISSPFGILTGLASNLLNIPVQLLSQILSLAGLGRILPGASSSQIINSPLDVVSGLISGVADLPTQVLSLGNIAGLGGILPGILSSGQKGLGSLGSGASILSLDSLGLGQLPTGLISIPSGILSGLVPGIANLPNQITSLGGNAGLSGIQPSIIASDQTDQLGATVNIVNGAGVQSQGHGSLGSGVGVSGNLGLDDLGLGGILGQIPNQITSSSSKLLSEVSSGISGLASGASGLASGVASGVSGLASGVSGLASGAASGVSGLASGVSGIASGVSGAASGISGLASSVSGHDLGVVGLPTQVVHVGGNAGISGILPGTASSDKTNHLGITSDSVIMGAGKQSEGLGGLGSGATISSTSNLGLGSVPTQIINTSSNLLPGLVDGVVGLPKQLVGGLLSG